MSECIGVGCTHKSHGHGLDFLPKPKQYISAEEYDALSDEEKKNFRQVERKNIPKHISLHKVGRNEICPCGRYNRKYKHCCLKKRNLAIQKDVEAYLEKHPEHAGRVVRVNKQ